MREEEWRGRLGLVLQLGGAGKAEVVELRFGLVQTSSLSQRFGGWAGDVPLGLAVTLLALGQRCGGLTAMDGDGGGLGPWALGGRRGARRGMSLCSEREALAEALAEAFAVFRRGQSVEVGAGGGGVLGGGGSCKDGPGRVVHEGPRS